MAQTLQLETSIGFSGRVPAGLCVHPNKEQIIYPLGCALVLEKIAGKKSQQFLVGDNNNISCVAVSRSGKYIATGVSTHQGYQADIVLWDAKTLKEKNRFKLHKVKVQALAFSCSERFLVSVGGQDDNTVVVWDLEKGAALCGAPISSSTAGSGLAVQCFHRSDTAFVTGGEGTMRVWDIDVENRKLRPTDISLGALRRVATCLQITEDDESAYFGTTTGDVVQASVRTKLLKSVGPEKHKVEQGITALALTRTGELLVGGGAGAIARVRPGTWKTEASKSVEGAVTSLAPRGEGLEVFAGTSTATILRVSYPDLAVDVRAVGHADRINQVAFPRGTSDLFATCSLNDIRVWQTATGKELLRISVPNKECHCIAFHPDGKAIVSGWDDGVVRAFTPQTGKLMYQIVNAQSKGVTALAFTNDATRLLTGGGEGLVRVWKLGKDTQTLVTGMKEHKGLITDIKVRQNDRECVSASADGTCIVWDLTRFVRNQILFANTMFKQVCYRPDEAQVLTVGTDRKAGYWEVFDGSLIREVEVSASAPVNALDLAADGVLFAAGGDDRLVKVFSYREGLCTHVGGGHSGNITHLRICPNQRHIVSVGADGGIFRWAFPSA